MMLESFIIPCDFHLLLHIINFALFHWGKVVRAMVEIESVFTRHFANNDRKKAMKFLRPQQQRDTHVVTFFVGKPLPLFVHLQAELLIRLV